MNNFYTTKDLVSFGQYLLSKERTERIRSQHEQGDSITLEERLSCVYDADLANWNYENGDSTAKRQALSAKLNEINDPELTRLTHDAQLELMRESEKATAKPE